MSKQHSLLSLFNIADMAIMWPTRMISVFACDQHDWYRKLSYMLPPTHSPYVCIRGQSSIYNNMYDYPMFRITLIQQKKVTLAWLLTTLCSYALQFRCNCTVRFHSSAHVHSTGLINVTNVALALSVLQMLTCMDNIEKLGMGPGMRLVN